MAKKSKTGLYIGLGALGLAAVYLLTSKKTTTITPVTAPATASASNNLLSQGTSLISSLSKLFGGGSSSPAPGSAAAFVPVGIAQPSPAAGSSQSVASSISYINPSAPTLALATPAYVSPDDNSDILSDVFNSNA